MNNYQSTVLSGNKNQKIRYKYFLLLVLYFPLIVYSQKNDSLNYIPVLSDSLKADSLAVIDTTILESTTKPKSAIQDKIPYKADRISISPNGNLIYLNGNAEIKYQNLTLNAEKITIDKINNKLFAQGVLDSVDSKGNKIFRGNPVFVEKGQEPMSGNKIEYDFSTRRGKIDIGRTNMEPGYYKGENIYKIADSTLLVEDGYFTTCDLPDNPHFYFRSDEMRLKMKDKVVARPIYFYIADIPLAVAPFGVFPNKGGRHSGLLIPSFGESKNGGRFLEDFGYYWAPNNYMDATLQTTFYDKLGFTFRGNVRYKLRYLLSGGLKGSYFPKDPRSGERRERWSFSYNHSQQIDPTFRISGRGSFQSNKDFRRQTSANIQERLEQNITSSLTISKNWKGTKNSLSLGFNHNQNLQNDESTWTLPSLNFRRGQSSIYETFTGEALGTNRAWYQDIYFSYNSNAVRKGSSKLNPEYADSLDNNEFIDRESAGIKHALSFSSPQKIFKYFSVNPSFSYDEIWVDEITKGRLNEDSTNVETYQKKQFAARRTFRSSVGINTKIYGMFEPNIGDLKFIRHTISPQVSFSYTPDFSQESYGYFDEVVNENGQVEFIDKFSRSPFGGTSRSESRSMNLTLNNLFQSKYIDEEGKEEKVDFFKANFGTAHNFKADSLKWSNLRSSFSTRVFGKDIRVTTTHSLYNLSKNGKVIDQLFYETGSLPRLLNLSTSFGYSINDKTFAPKKETEKNQSRKEKRGNGPSAQIEIDEAALQDSLEQTLGFESTQAKEKEITKKINIPWSTSFNLNYSLNKSDPNNTTERISLSTSAQLSLSKNWKIRWQGSFDLVEKDLVYHSFNIYRDLHCWEMSFNWQPTQQYFRFQINIKEQMLQDIKLTKRPTGNYYPNY